MPELEINLFGHPSIRSNGKELATDRRKTIALLAYLAVTGRSHSRDHLAGFFWPDYPRDSAYAYLRRALWELNKGIGKGWILADRSQVSFDFTAGAVIDTVRFEAALRGAPEEQDLEAAVQLYKGDFLADFYVPDAVEFEGWQQIQAENFRRSCAGALEELVKLCTDREDWDAALAHAQAWLQLDVLNEQAHRALMRIYSGMGDRAGALRQYESCQAVLKEQAGLDPAPETESLYRELIEGGSAAAPHPERPPEPAAGAPSQLAGPHLPALATPFIGRQKEVDEIVRLIASPENRLVTLAGPGGTGKTRLAIAAAAEAHAHFRDGAWFISLAQIESPEEIVPAMAESLAFSFYSDEESARTELLNFLRNKAMLIVLDNLEQLVGPETSAFLNDLLAGSEKVKLLATSRTRLNLAGEQLYPVLGMLLPTPEQAAGWSDPAAETAQYSGLRLFLDRAKRARPDFTLDQDNLPAVLETCRLVGGMPLALELAASWLELLQPEAIAAEIRRSLDFLETDQVGVPDRQRSLRAVFESSWKLLGAEERESFLHLCVFAGSFSREAAQEVSGASLRTLLGLAHKSWLQQTIDGRFQLHELMRQYGVERLRSNESAWQDAKDRHAAYFAAFVRSQTEHMQSSDQVAGLRALFEEFSGNVRAAWDWLVARERWDLLVEDFALGLLQYTSIRWEYHRMIPWFRSARLALEGKREERLAYAVMGTLEIFCEGVGEGGVLEVTIERLVQLLAIVQKEGLAGPMGFWFLILAGMARIRDLGGDMQEQIAENIAELKNQDRRWELGIGLMSEANGWIGTQYSLHLASVDLMMESGDILRGLGVIYEQGLVEEALAKTTFLMRGPIEDVLTHYENARRFFRQMEGLSRPGINLDHLVDVYFRQGEFEKAFALLQEEQVEFERRGDPHLLGWALHWEALHASRFSSFTHALEARQKCLTLARSQESPNIFINLFELGEVHRIFGNLDQARAYYDQAIVGMIQMNLVLDQGFHARALGDLALVGGRYADALDHYQQYLAYAREENHVWGMTQAQGKIALARAYLGEITAARESLQAALKETYNWRGDDLGLQILLAEPVCLWQEGEKEEAIALAAFLRHQHLSWNETKNLAGKILLQAAEGLPEKDVQAAIERGKSIDLDETLARWGE